MRNNLGILYAGALVVIVGGGALLGIVELQPDDPGSTPLPEMAAAAMPGAGAGATARVPAATHATAPRTSRTGEAEHLPQSTSPVGDAPHLSVTPDGTLTITPGETAPQPTDPTTQVETLSGSASVSPTPTPTDGPSTTTPSTTAPSGSGTPTPSPSDSSTPTTPTPSTEPSYSPSTGGHGHGRGDGGHDGRDGHHHHH